MPKRSTVCLILVVLCLGTLALGQGTKTLTASEASQHVGERATVCGLVASAHFAAGSRGGPTFLNLDKPYPAQIFTVLIWREDRAKFGSPEVSYASRHNVSQARLPVTEELLKSLPAKSRKYKCRQNKRTSPITVQQHLLNMKQQIA